MNKGHLDVVTRGILVSFIWIWNSFCLKRQRCSNWIWYNGFILIFYRLCDGMIDVRWEHVNLEFVIVKNNLDDCETFIYTAHYSVPYLWQALRLCTRPIGGPHYGDIVELQAQRSMEIARAFKSEVLSQSQWQKGNCERRATKPVRCQAVKFFHQQPLSAQLANVTAQPVAAAAQPSRLPSKCCASNEASGRMTEAAAVLQTCKQCLQQFDPSCNGPTACRQAQGMLASARECARSIWPTPVLEPYRSFP